MRAGITLRTQVTLPVLPLLPLSPPRLAVWEPKHLATHLGVALTTPLLRSLFLILTATTRLGMVVMVFVALLAMLIAASSSTAALA